MEYLQDIVEYMWIICSQIIWDYLKLGLFEIIWNWEYFFIICSQITPPSSVVVNTQSRLSREPEGSWFETCLDVWYPRRRPCGVAINTLVDLINWLGNFDNLFSDYLRIIIWNIDYLRLFVIKFFEIIRESGPDYL